MKKIFHFLAILILPIILLMPVVGFTQTDGPDGNPPAQGTDGPDGTSGPISHAIKFENPLKLGDNATISSFIESVLRDIVVPIGAVVSVFFIIYAGFMFVTAQGSEDKVTKAKTALLNAVIGTVIILGSWVIAQAISGTVAELGGPTL